MSHTTEGHERKRVDETDDGGEIILQIGFNLKKIKMIFRIYARLWETDVRWPATCSAAEASKRVTKGEVNEENRCCASHGR
jgi:hypothetical protein